MATENYDLNINVKTNAEGSVGSLKKQLREAQAEVALLSDKFGATSQQASLAAKKAAELRDRIGDAKALTDAFNPDAKFKAVTASLAGLAGGFGAVQGAMALFGAETDNVQKTLLKVQSAMALSQGLNAVGESIDSFKTLASQISGNVIKAFTTLRGAIIATGVGALAIGIGLLVANFEKVKETINNLFPSLGEFADKVKGIVQIVTDWAGITSQAARNQDDLKKATEASIFSLDQSIKILQSQDGKEAEIYDLKKQRIKAQISLLKDEKDETIKKRVELNTELTILDNEEQKRKDKKAEEERKKAQKLEDEKRAFNLRAKLQTQQEDLALAEDGKKLQAEADKSDADAAKAAEDDRIKGLQYITDRTIEVNKIRKDSDDNALANKKANDAAVLEAQYQLEDAKFAAVSAGLGLLESLAGKNEALANTIFIVDRAMAIAKVVVDTQREIAGYYANPLWSAFPDGGLTVKTAAATGAKIRAGISIATIAATSIAKFKGGGSSGASVGVPSMSTAAPIAPQLPTASTTNISQQSINDIGNNAVRAYVVESDVTSSQDRITSIRQRARFS
jgi:hypothetical protein